MGGDVRCQPFSDSRLEPHWRWGSPTHDYMVVDSPIDV